MIMLLKGVFVICGVLFFLVTRSGGSAFAAETGSVWTKNLPYESWMNAQLLGVKVGHLHIYADRARYNEQNVLRVNSEMFTEIKRFGLSISIMKTKMFYLKDDLTPCYFLSRSNETGQEKIVEGTIDNGVIKIKITLEGKITEKQITLPQDVTFAEALEEITLRKGLKEGNKFALKVFSLDSYDTMNITVNVVGKDKIEYKNQLKDVFAVDYTMDIMGGITTREWLAPDGEVYKMEMANMGMSFFKVDREEAIGEVGQLDLILQTRIDLAGERPVPNSQRFKVKASLTEGDLLATFVNDDRQKVSLQALEKLEQKDVQALGKLEQKDVQALEKLEQKDVQALGKLEQKNVQALEKLDDHRQGFIEVALKDVDVNSAPQLPITSQEFLPYLMPSIHIQSDDPDIISKAREIAGTEKNAWTTAVKVYKWVNENIRDKNYKVGFGTAKQTLKDLQGDCSEHTVLFIGLARALGIPSRICTGIVYHRDAFYYHFWPEVYAGRWIGMDPTLGQIQADALHLKFSGAQLETESAIELGEGVLRTMNKLRLERINE